MLRIVIRIFFVLVMLCVAHQSHAFTCFGKLPTDAQVCGGNGLCKAQDSCECLDLSTGNYMHSSINGTIPSGVSIWNPQRSEFLILQSDGNLVLYQSNGVADWAEGYKQNQYPNYIKLDGSSGALTLVNSYSNVYQMFSSGCSGGIGPFRLVVRSDRNFAVYDSVGKQCWIKQIFTTAPALYYGGPNCDQGVCFYKSGASACSSQGTCVSYNKCKCNDGYYGDECEYPYYCYGISGSRACYGRGVCSSYNNCTCRPGYSGIQCGDSTCFGKVQDACSGHGTCIDIDKCLCTMGYTGSQCDRPVCYGQSSNATVCSGRGSCIAPDTCICPSGYGGYQCDRAICYRVESIDPRVCSGKGVCVAPNKCTCQSGWNGSLDCSSYSCDDSTLNNCSYSLGRGICSSSNNCTCNPGFTGLNCSTAVDNSDCVWPNVQSVGAPTPTISSNIDGKAISFTVSFKLDKVPYQHLFFIGDSKFQNCSVNGNQNIALTLLGQSSCQQIYSTQNFTIDSLISNPQVIKQYSSNVLVLKVPISMHYLDRDGSQNGGFCRNYEFKTHQLVYIQSGTVIGSFEQYNPIYGYSTVIYPQELTTTSNGRLSVSIVLKATNLTLNSFTFLNTTASYSIQVTESILLFQNSDSNFYEIHFESLTAANDYRSLTFFTGTFTRKGFSDIVTLYFPIQIEYSIVTPPSDKNFTLQGSMYVAGYDWSPKSSFKAGDRVFVNVQSSNVNSFNSRLVVSDAYLCCFKETIFSLNYNPSLGQYGCTKFNSTSMDVQQSVISNNVGNSKVSTIIYPQASNYVSTFSFALNPSLFPLANSQTAKSCFIQTNIGLASLTRSVTQSEDQAEGAVISNFIILSSNEIPRTISSAQSINSFQFIFALAVIIVSLIL